MEKIYFETYEELLAAPGLTSLGLMAYVNENNTVYVRKETGWEPLKIDQNSNIEMTSYDMNKQIISQMKPMKRKEIERKYGLIEDFRRVTKNQYYLLYGKEISYFTLFVRNDNTKASIALEFMECLYNIGDIYDILLTEAQDAVEIWVKPKGAEEVTCLYFFPYDTGIVPFKGD